MIETKTYRCQDCQDAFASVSVLTAHTFKVHGRTGRVSEIRGIRRPGPFPAQGERL